MMAKSHHEQLEDYANKSSMHALPIAILYKGVASRVFWTLVWVCGTIVGTGHIYQQFRHYRSYPHDVNIMLVSSDSLTFPAVTFCNMAPIKKSKLFCESPVLQGLLRLELTGEASANLSDEAVFPLDSFWECKQHNQTNGTQTGDDYTFLPAKFCDNGKITVKPPTNQSNETIQLGHLHPAGQAASVVTQVPGSNQIQNDDHFKDYYTDLNDYEHFLTGILKPASVITEGYLSLIKLSRTDDLTDLQGLMQFSPELLLRHGFTLKDMLVSCSFNGFNCSQRFFTTNANSKHGLCHTFSGQPTNNSHDAIKTKRQGFQNGLKLILNIHSDEYLGLLASTYGVRVALHSPEHEAPIDRSSISIAPGKETSFAMTMVEVQRLMSPYKSKCSQSYPDQYIPYVYGTGHYTQDSCYAACTRYYLTVACNCTQLLSTADENNRVDILCRWTTDDERQTACHMYVSLHLSQNSSDPDALVCDCPNACNEKTYRTSTSSAIWPTTSYRHLLSRNSDALKDNGLKMFLSNVKMYKNEFMTKYSNFYGIELEPRKIKDLVKENLVHLNVYYKHLNFERIEEKEAYRFSSFLADIGGILGLYIGVSIISFIEIFEAIYLAFYYMFSAPKTNQHQPESSNFQNKKVYPLPSENDQDGNASVTLPHLTGI